MPKSAGAPFAQEGNGHASLHDAVSDRLLQERIIFLGSQVDDDIADQICAQMLLLSADDPRRDVHLYINSPGGSVSAGMAVYDTMRFIDCDVATYSFGMAASMGQFLLTAGTPGRRFSLPHTRIMMHQPSAGVGGTQSDITIQADMLRRLERDIDQLQAEHSGQSVEQVERDADRDRWSTPNRPASTASSTTSSPRPGCCRARPGGRPVTRPDDAPAQDRRPAALGRRPLG